MFSLIIMIAITESHLIHITNEEELHTKVINFLRKFLSRINYSIRMYKSNNRPVKNTVQKTRL